MFKDKNKIIVIIDHIICKTEYKIYSYITLCYLYLSSTDYDHKDLI